MFSVMSSITGIEHAAGMNTDAYLEFMSVLSYLDLKHDSKD